MSKSRLLRLSIAFSVFLIIGLAKSSAQNLVYDGDFNESGLGWTTSCVSVEAWGFETTYGGTDPTNHVAEIDDEACMHQDVCVLPGYSYIYNMEASRRTAGGPNPCTTHIAIYGLDASSTIVATYVSMDFTRTNTVFGFTPVTGIPIVNVPSCSGVVRLRIELTDNTPGYSTLGMIVDNISLVYAGPPSITGPSVTCINSPNSYIVPAAPACLTYYWALGTGAIPSSSVAPAPIVEWSSPGSKTIVLALSNGVCADTLTYPVTVNGMAFGTVMAATCGQPYTFAGHVYTVSGVYTDTLVATGGCDSVLTLNLTVGSKPAPPVPVPATYCQFAPAAPLSATGISLTWFGPGLTSGTSIPPAPNTSVTGNDSFYVTQTVLGCVSDSALDVVTINPTPAPPTARDTGYCQNQPAVQLSASGIGIQWFNNPTGGTALSAAPVPSTIGQGAFKWYISQTINGCTSNRIPVQVTVAPLPFFTIAANKVNICLNDTAELYYSGQTTISQYAWTLATGDYVLSGSLAASGISVLCTALGKQYIYLKVTDSGGACTATDTLALNVVPYPSAMIQTPGEVCLGDTVTLALAAHSMNSENYYWYIDNTPLLQSGIINILYRNVSTGGPFDISWNTAGPHLVALYTVSQEGCRSETVYDSVNVHNVPNAAFTYNAASNLCLQDSVLFQAIQSGYGYYYFWSPAAFFSNINESSAWGTISSQKSNISLTVSDAYGCKSTTSQELDPSLCCQIVLPNAFTPNGDGRNDVFRPLGSGLHTFHKFTIANRWGQIVFESANSKFEWDGNFNGVPQEMDVYYYILSYDCGGKTLEQKGDVTLIR